MKRDARRRGCGEAPDIKAGNRPARQLDDLPEARHRRRGARASRIFHHSRTASFLAPGAQGAASNQVRDFQIQAAGSRRSGKFRLRRPRTDFARPRCAASVHGWDGQICARNCARRSTRKQAIKNVLDLSRFLWSEWQDLNLRPPRPERGARPSASANLGSKNLASWPGMAP
jgi:hypothetical protein